MTDFLTMPLRPVEFFLIGLMVFVVALGVVVTESRKR